MQVSKPSNKQVTKQSTNELAPVERQRLLSVQNRLRRLSLLLDEAFTIPVLNIKIGWDAIIGFVPVIGDLVGALLSGYLVIQAKRLGVGKMKILRMLLNIGIELVLGLVPVIGDFFDVAWRANRKNYQLLESDLERMLESPAVQATRSTNTKVHVWALLLGALSALALLLLLADVADSQAMLYQLLSSTGFMLAG